MLKIKLGLKNLLAAAVFAFAALVISAGFAEAALLPVNCGSWYWKGSRCVSLQNCAGINPCTSVNSIPAGCPYPYYEKYRGKSGTKKYYTCLVDPVYKSKECGVVDYRLVFGGQCITRESCNGYNMCSLFWKGYGVTCPANYLAVTIGTKQGNGWNVATCRYSPPPPPPCSNECSVSRLKACSGNGFKTCGNFDADSCLEWSAVTACGAGQICSNGLCVTENDPPIPSGYKRYEFKFNSGNENKINFVIANNYPDKGVSIFNISNLKSKAAAPYLTIASINVDSNGDNMPDGWIRASAGQNFVYVNSAGTKIITDNSTYGYQIMQRNIPVQKNKLYTIILDVLIANGGFQAGILSGDESRWINYSTDAIAFTPNISTPLFSSESSDPGEWRMLGRFLNHTAYNPVDAPTNLSANVNWNNISYAVGIYESYSSPVISNGIVYVGSWNNTFYALNASNISKQIANFTAGNVFDVAAAISDGVAYVGCRDKRLYALNASNISRQIANVSIASTIYFESSPAVANGIVYVGSDNNRLYALNASNISKQIANFTTGSYIFSSPAVANGIVYVGSKDNSVYALNASNISRMIGNFSAPGGYGAGGDFDAPPVVYEGIVYIGNEYGVLYALNASNISKQIANYTTGNGIMSHAAVANGIVYVGSVDDSLYALNASNISKQIGNFTSGGDFDSGPVVANGVVYIGGFDNTFYALNASNVNQQFSNYTMSRPIPASAAIANGIVYVGSGDGRIYSFGLWQGTTK